jgi:hypothetical protein
MRRSGRTAAVLALAGLVLAGLAGWFARVEGHWSVDSAVWELMTREVARRGWDGLWVRNLAQEVDPEGRFFPGFFFVRRGDRYHFSFQPAFALLTAPFYRALGRAGTAVLPVAAALLLAWVVARGTDALVPGWGWVGATAVLFLTPVPLYAATVWNHLPSVALLTLGALLAWRSGVEGNWRPSGVFLAGASVGSALLFRNEAYVYFAALLVAWVLSTPGPPRTWPYGDFRGPGTASLGGSPGPVSRETLGGAAVGPRWLGAVLLVAGFAAGWSLQAGLNWQLFGSAFGPKAESVAARQASGAVDLGYRLWNAYLFLAAPDFGAFLRGGVERGLLLFAPVVLAGLVLALPGVEGRGKAAATALWAVAAADVAVLAGRTQVTGFFWVAPYLVVSVLHRPLTPTRTFLGTLAVLFAAGVVWTASHGGFQWGPRYLLAAYPLAVWLAVDAWRSAGPGVQRALRAPVAVLGALALLAQAAGVDHADQGQWRATQALRTIRSLPTRYVVVGLEIFAWDFAPAYGEKVLMSVDSQAELEEAVRRLARAGIQSFTYVPRSGLRFDRQVVERVEAAGRRYRVVKDEARGDLRLVQYGLVTTP